MAAISTLFAAYIGYDFAYNKKARATPSKLMLGRTLANYAQILIYFFTARPYGKNKIDECTKCITCHVLGALFTIFLLCGAVYYTSICVDLYFTIKNPFRKPFSNSIMIHFVVYIVASIIVAILSAFRPFEYRPDLQFCWVRYDKGINPWNVGIVYIPAFLFLVPGVFVTYWTLKRYLIYI